MKVNWCLSFVSLVAVASAAKDHKIELWENEDFKGVGVTINVSGRRAFQYCDTIGDEWWNRVSSIRTHEECYEIYEFPSCNGDVRYLYPGSPNHHDLGALNFNDKMKSFRLCDLNEEAVDGQNPALERRSLDPNRPERGFWEYFFRRFNNSYLQKFLQRANRSWFINWNFLPNVFGSKGQQYQSALSWVNDIITGGNFGVQDLEELRRRAAQVVNDRAERNRAFASSSFSRSDAIHHQLERVWEDLRNTLDSQISRERNDEDGHDENR